MTIQDRLDAMGVRVSHKRSSWMMRFIGLILPAAFSTRFWTTVSGWHIHAPNGADLKALEKYESIILHELVHIRQARRFPGHWQLSYLLLPLPIGLAWFRWLWEREAYLVNIRAGTMSAEDVVQTLGSVNYFWSWPRPWMRRWFKKAEKR